MRASVAGVVVVVGILVGPLVGGAWAGRLPEGVRPERYRIELAVDLEAGTFQGEETIEVQLARPADRIVLHSLALTIDEARVGRGEALAPVPVTVDDKQETIALGLAAGGGAGLPAGPARVALRFHGPLDDRLRGLYLARAEGKRFAVTQFEGTDARRAFPCFDEPAYKARFQLTAIVARGLAAISNTPVVKRALLPDGKRERVEFGETLPMSSYLVALAVGPFSSRTLVAAGAAGPTPITVWAATGREGLGDYALREAAAILPRLEAWFGIPYPYGKLDLIAAPEFQFGGMENVAAITFHPAALLVDEKVASPAARKRVTEVIAHEIAHQWFGDLVTMAWWDDVWLNESFATWMERKIVEQLHPEWRLGREAAVERRGPLAVDELPSAHPIRARMLAGGEEPESSPTIVYGKGAAVLRMIERWLGEERFQHGVRRYLTQHQFGNTVAADFFGALGTASGEPVGEVAERWISEAGHPLVSLAATCEGQRTRVTLRQERLYGDGRAAAPGAEPHRPPADRWPTPVCLRYPTGPKQAPGELCSLLRGAEATVELPAEAGCAPWVLGNAGAGGFYRVTYSEPALAVLSRVAASALQPAERVALLDDQWALVAAGKAPMKAWFDLAGALVGERDLAVLEALAGSLGEMDRALADGAEPRAGLLAMAERLFGPPLAALTMAPRAGEDDEAVRTRALAIRTLGLLGSPRVLGKAREQAQAYLTDPRSVTGALADAWIAVAATRGDAALFDRLQARLQADPAPEDRLRLIDGLARFERPELLERGLALSLSGALRTDELDRPLRVAFSTRSGHDAALAFLEKQVGALQARTSPFGMIRVVMAAGGLCGDDEARRVAAVFAAHPPARGQLAVALTLERIQVCGALRRRGEGPIVAALRAQRR